MKNRKNTRLKSFADIYKRLEEVMLANSGANEFEEIFKLIIIKLWDEKQSSNSLDSKIVAENTLKIIDSKWNGIINDKTFNITDDQFDICSEIIKNFTFHFDNFECLDLIFEYIFSKEKKGEKGQFFTPRYIVDFCVDMINPKKEESILDPASGSGAFLYHSCLRDGIEGDQIWGFDFDKTAIRISRLLFNISGIKNYHLYKLNSLLKPSKQPTLIPTINDLYMTIEDIKRLEKKKDLFDVIITNPPFAGEIIETNILNNYYVAIGKKRIERDCLFLERCINLLNDHGRMAIILPDNIFGGNENEYIRKWINSKCRIIGVIGIPRNAFMPHTSIKTSILFLQKRTCLKQNYEEKIFFGICEKSGKDSRGRHIYKTNDNTSWRNINHDLSEISFSFKKFINDNNIEW